MYFLIANFLLDKNIGNTKELVTIKANTRYYRFALAICRG